MTRRPKKQEKPLTPELPFDGAVAPPSQADIVESRVFPTAGGMIEDLMLAFEYAAHHDDDGAEYWLARELQPLLGYTTWQNFQAAITKAKAACSEVSEPAEDHFMHVHKMVNIGSGARREQLDIELSRFACYLIAQNGDPTKRPEIAAAQTYFAIQTRRQEVADQVARQLSDDEKRVLLRDKLKEHNKLLASAAKYSGVKNFRNFNGAGLKGLYGGLNQEQVIRRKKLPSGSNHLDHADHEELAANYFKATQTEARLRREGEVGQRRAENVHSEVGQAIHKLIVDQGNIPPEDKVALDHVDDARKRLKAAQPIERIEES
jgi:DNA-damage-inducible protein D